MKTCNKCNRKFEATAYLTRTCLSCFNENTEIESGNLTDCTEFTGPSLKERAKNANE